MDVGTMLRTARERSGLSLSTLAARTKIPVRVLAALEDNAFERVARGIFVRGYLRAYAAEVGLEPEAVVQQFREETGDLPPVTAPEPLGDELDNVRIELDTSGSGPGWGSGLIVAALLVAFVSFTRSTPPSNTSGVAAGGIEELAGPTLQQASAIVNELTPVATTGQGVRLDLHIQGPCWVEAIVDGRRIVYRLMQAGDRESFDVGRELVMRVGDPGALTYSINGKAGEPLGRPGMPVTVRFTSEDGLAKLAS